MQNMKPSPEEVVARRKKDSLWQELADAALCDFELALGDDAEKAAERAAAGIIDQGLSAAENVSQAEAKHATEAKEDDLDRPPIVNEWTKKLLDALGAIGLTETPRVFAARELATVYHKTIEGTGARGNELEKTLAAVDANAAARDDGSGNRPRSSPNERSTSCIATAQSRWKRASSTIESEQKIFLSSTTFSTLDGVPRPIRSHVHRMT